MLNYCYLLAFMGRKISLRGWMLGLITLSNPRDVQSASNLGIKTGIQSFLVSYKYSEIIYFSDCFFGISHARCEILTISKQVHITPSSELRLLARFYMNISFDFTWVHIFWLYLFLILQFNIVFSSLRLSVSELLHMDSNKNWQHSLIVYLNHCDLTSWQPIYELCSSGMM